MNIWIDNKIDKPNKAPCNSYSTKVATMLHHSRIDNRI